MSDFEDEELVDEMEEANFDEEFMEFLREREENPEEHDDRVRQMQEEEDDFYSSFTDDEFVEGEDEDVYGEEENIEEDELQQIIDELFADADPQEDGDEEDEEPALESNGDEASEGHGDEEYEDEEAPEETGDEDSNVYRSEAVFEAPRLGANISADASASIKATQKGVEIIKNLISPKITNKIEFLAKLTPLGKIYECAKELAAIHSFLVGKSDDSDVNQLLRKLDEVIGALKNVQSSITQGFSDLIASDYERDFKNGIQANADYVFDRMIRCFEVRSERTKDEFMECCEQENTRPAKLLSNLFTAIRGEENIIEKQLKATGYIYKTYEEWYKRIYYNLTCLVLCNTFYYGWKLGSSKADIEFQGAELKNVIKHSLEMISRLNDIEKERMKKFHKGGFAAKLLLEKFNEVKEAYPGARADWGTEFLTRAATNLRKKWEKENGPSGFYLAVLRGYNMKDGCSFNDAEFNVGDSSSVTILKNAAYADGSFFRVGYDGINVVLIQPVTAEMISKHKAKYEDQDMRNKVMKIMEDAFYGRASNRYRFDKVEGKLLELMGQEKPLLMMFSTDMFTGHRVEKPKFMEYAYRMVGETSTTKEALRTVKFDMHARSQYVRGHQPYSIRALLQIIYK